VDKLTKSAAINYIYTTQKKSKSQNVMWQTRYAETEYTMKI